MIYCKGVSTEPWGTPADNGRHFYFGVKLLHVNILVIKSLFDYF